MGKLVEDGGVGTLGEVRIRDLMLGKMDEDLLERGSAN